MTDSVASQPHVRVRAEEAPTEDGRDAFMLALENIIASSVSDVNGTSTALEVSAEAEPTATDSAAAETEATSESESASVPASGSGLETSAVSEVQPESTLTAIESTTAVSESGASFVPSSSAVASAQRAGPSPVPDPAPETTGSTLPRSASESNESRNFVATSSAPSDAEAPARSAAPTTERSTTFRTDATSSLASTAVDEPSTSESHAAPPTSVPATTSAFRTTTTAASAPTTTAPTQTFSFALSSSSPSVSTQRLPATSGSASTTASGNDQAASSAQPTNTASSGQQSDSSPSSAPDEESSPSGVSLRGSDLSASDIPATSSPPSAAHFANSIQADSTLQTAQAVTLTSDGSIITTTPALITSISVSSGKDGVPPQTFTSVFANPTSVPESSGLSEQSFWDNRGAVAGVFITIAVVILSTILGIFYCCRRRRRMEHTLADNAQFHLFSGLPDMSEQRTTYHPVRAQNFVSDDPRRNLMAPSLTSGLSHGHDPAMIRSASQVSHNSSDAQHPGALGLTGLPAKGLREYHDPFSDYHRYISTGDTRLYTPPREPVGIAVTTNFTTREVRSSKLAERETGPIAERPRSRSPAPSTPSIYPPSLPTVHEKDEEAYLFYERETRRPDSKLPTPPPTAVVINADPRDPFSSPLDPVYDAAAPRQNLSVPRSSPTRLVTNQDYRPLTPPDSSPGHSPTTPQSSCVAVDSTKPLSITPFPKNAFLGRSVSTRTEPLPRPKRSPLRLSSSSSLIQQQQQTQPSAGMPF